MAMYIFKMFFVFLQIPGSTPLTADRADLPLSVGEERLENVMLTHTV